MAVFTEANQDRSFCSEQKQRILDICHDGKEERIQKRIRQLESVDPLRCCAEHHILEVPKVWANHLKQRRSSGKTLTKTLVICCLSATDKPCFLFQGTSEEPSVQG